MPDSRTPGTTAAKTEGLAAHRSVFDHVHFLYGRLPTALVASALVALVLAGGQMGAVPTATIATWLAVYATVSLGRLGLALAYRRTPPDAERAPLWRDRFRIGALLGGLSWALGAYLLFPPGDTPHQAFVGFAVAGVAAGASSSIASDRWSFVFFAGPPLAALFTLFAAEPGVLATSIAAMVVFYCAFLTAGSGQSKSWLGEIARLKDEAEARAHDLAASKDRLLNLFDTTSDLIQSVGPDRRIAFVNRAWRETLGYSEAEAIGRDAFDFIAPDDVEHCAAVFRDLQAGKPQTLIDVAFVAKDGRRVPLEGNITVQFENGMPVATRAFFRDVTARKKAEDALRKLNVELESRVAERTAALAESERFSRGIVDAVSAQLAVLDHDGRIVATNARWHQNGAASSHDWLAIGAGAGANYLAACEHADGPYAAQARAIAAGIRGVIAGQQPMFQLEYSVDIAGAVHWYTFRANAFASDGPQRVVITHIDSTAVHQAMDQASANERVLASLARVSPIGFFRAKPDGAFEYVNHRWCEIVGLSEDQALGHGYTQAIHPDDRARVLNEWQTATNLREPFKSEFRVKRSDGAVSWVLSHAVEVTDADGEATSHIGTLTDITDRKQIEMAMQALSSTLINLEGTAYIEAAAHRLTTLLDMELCGISQYDQLQANEVRILTMVEDGVIRPPSRAQIAGSPGGRVAAGKPIVIEHGAQEKYPDAKYIQANAIDSYIGEPLIDPAGKSIGHVAVMSRRPVRDIETATTILRMFAVAISAAMVRERNRRQYADLFQFAPDGLILTDQRGHVDLANLRTEAIFGFTSAELRGKPIESLFGTDPVSDGESLEGGLRAIRQTGATSHAQLMLRGLRKDGTEFPAEVHLAPVASDHGVAIAAAIRDVTARKALEAQLAQAGRLEAIGRITGGLAHDFNNYLGIIIGHLDLLQEMIGNDHRAIKHVEAALNGALRSAELTQSLLAYSRKQPLTPRLTDIGGRIASLTPLIEHTLGKNISFTARTAPDLWPIKVDGAQFDSCLVNLATNARDAMPAGGSLAIEARNITLDAAACAQVPDARPGDHVLIEIADTGQGMRPEVLAQAFEPFFTTKGPGHGTGLGLSMVYGFVRQSGGHVRIESKLGRGTRVQIHLPRAEAIPAVLPDERAAPATPRGSETILVVEDNAQVLRAAVDQIESLGYRVIGVENAEAALTALERHQDLDLLFTDIVMPGALNGYQLAEQTRRRWPDIKILLTSGFPGDTASAPEPPAPMLNKPYRKDQLAQAIRKALDGQSAA